MTAIFPAFLQGKFLRRSWSESRRKHFTEFETDSGDSLRSKVPGSAKTDCSGEMSLTESEFEALEAFYINDCSEGTVGFYLEHPRRKTNTTFQWRGPPTVVHIGFKYWRVSLALIAD